MSTSYSPNIAEGNTYDAIVAKPGGGGLYPAQGYADDADSLQQIIVGQGFSTDQITYVVPFKLPYLAPGQTISTATLQIHYSGHSGSPTQSIDLYGLTRVDTNPTCWVGDYYEGSSDSANTKLQSGFITSATAAGYLTLSGSSLVTWLNTQYAKFSSSLGNCYVFFRLNSSTDTGNSLPFETGYIIDTADSATRAFVPTLTLTTAVGAPKVASCQVPFVFTLPTAAFTSAGVFNSTTGALIKHLWENVPYPAGPCVGGWDGTSDAGAAEPEGSYTIKVIYHNSTYTWNGSYGNTSSNQSGQNVWRGFYLPCDMCIAGGKAWYALGYNESQTMFNYFTTGTPQAITQVQPNGITNDPFSNFDFVTTDGTIAYYAKGKGGASPAYTYIVGVNISTGNQQNFTGGSAVSGGNQKWTNGNVIDLDTTSGQPNPASGLAVQPSGNFLFASHNSLGIVRTFNKTTGAPATSASFTPASAPGRICCDPSGNLYVALSTGIQKYTINASTGAATASGSAFGPTDVIGMAVDPTGTYITVARSTTHQVVSYQLSSTGSPFWTLGTSGGQPTAGPVVSNTTFWFNTNTANGVAQTFVAYQSDGTFWFCDTANNRMLHYSVSGTALTYVEQIAYIPENYTTTVNATNPVQLFNLWLEYGIYYAQSPGGTNGSWALTNNWAANLPAAYTAVTFPGFPSVATLGGQTYAVALNHGTGNYDILQLTSTGVRVTNVTGLTSQPRIYSDGSLRTQTNSATNMVFYTQPFAGLDGFSNPVWGAPQVLASTTSASGQPGNNDNIFSTHVEQTSGGILPVYDPGASQYGYHMGGLVAGANSSWQFLSLITVPKQGKLFFTGQPAVSDSFTIGVTTYTFVASGATGNQINIGANLAATMTNAAAVVTASGNANIGSCVAGSAWIFFTGTGSSTTIAATVSSSVGFWNADVTYNGNELGYSGGFPKSGTFDIFNQVQYAGSVYMTTGANIIAGYHGELWKQSEASSWIHMHETGLVLGTFGLPSLYVNGSTTTNGFSGNCFNPTLVTFGGTTYLFANDESNHGAVVSWVLNLNPTVLQATVTMPQLS